MRSPKREFNHIQTVTILESREGLTNSWHSTDQFISAAATNWATQALVAAVRARS